MKAMEIGELPGHPNKQVMGRNPLKPEKDAMHEANKKKEKGIAIPWSISNFKDYYENFYDLNSDPLSFFCLL